MMDKFEGQGEVDLPHWWQSKIIKSESMITSSIMEFAETGPGANSDLKVDSSETLLFIWLMA